jgi:hypothetical protein
MIVSVFALTQIVDYSDMPWVKPSPEAPGHLRVPVGFVPSLSKIIVSSNVLIHFLEKIFQGLRRLPSKILCHWTWAKSFDHGFDNNFIWHCRCLVFEVQEPSDICLKHSS